MNMSLHPYTNLKNIQELVEFRPKLKNLEVLGIVCILYKSTAKLALIKEILPGPDEGKNPPYVPLQQWMAERVKRLVPAHKQIPEKLLLSFRVKTVTCYLLNIMLKTLTEIMAKQSTAYLEYMLHCENLTLLDNINLKEEHVKYTKTIDELKEKIRNFNKDTSKTQFYLTETAEPCLEQASINSWIQEKVNHSYFSAIEKTGVQQNKLSLIDKEVDLTKSIYQTDTDIDGEKKVHKEIEEHLNYELTLLTNKLQQWTDRYNDEIERLDVEILQMKSKQEKQLKEIKTTLEVYQKQQEPLQTLHAERNNFNRVVTEQEKYLRTALQGSFNNSGSEFWAKEIGYHKKKLL